METFTNQGSAQNQEDRISKAKRRQTVRRAAMWFGVFLVIGGAVFGVMKISRSTPGAGETASLVSAISSADWVKGDKEAKVIIVEYSDFQCPACGAYHPVLKRLSEEFGDKIGFVYRHFPLPQHTNARPAARAAEAAGRQGKFWEMHDIIFENQQEWSESQNGKNIFEKYAETLKLDMNRFKSDVDAKEISDKVSADFESGTKSGVNATPTFFLNGKAIANPGGYDGLRNAISQAIANNS